MRLRILELPMRHVGELSETPFALVIDRCTPEQATIARFPYNLGETIGAVGAIIFEDEVDLGDDLPYAPAMQAGESGAINVDVMNVDRDAYLHTLDHEITRLKNLAESIDRDAIARQATRERWDSVHATEADAARCNAAHRAQPTPAPDLDAIVRDVNRTTDATQAAVDEAA